MTIDEDEVAVVEAHRPPPCGAHNPMRTDFDGLPRAVTEVFDDDAALLFGGAWKNDDRRVDRKRNRGRFALTIIYSFADTSPLLTRPQRSVDHEPGRCRQPMG